MLQSPIKGVLLSMYMLHAVSHSPIGFLLASGPGRLNGDPGLILSLYLHNSTLNPDSAIPQLRTLFLLVV